MRVSRIFVDQPLAIDQPLVIVGQRAHYIRNVLRLSTGNEVHIFNGTGGEFGATLQEVGKKETRVHLHTFFPADRSSSLKLTLGLAVIRRDAMDFAIQKAVELGVSEIVPLVTERVSVPARSLPTRETHWREVALSACEQCGLNLVPHVKPAVSLANWFSMIDGPGLIANPQAGDGPSIQPASQLNLLVGPEGGFSSHELELASAAGFVGTCLGPRILRAETAAISLMSYVHTRWGDFL